MKLFVSDLDGTLLTDSHEIDETIIKGVDALIQNGNAFAIATGRHMLPAQLKNFGLMGHNIHYIVMNGAKLLDPEGKTLKSIPIDPAVIRQLTKEFSDLPIQYVGMEKELITLSEENFIQSFREASIWNDVFDNDVFRTMLLDCVFDQTTENITESDILKLEANIIDPERNQRLKDILAHHGDALVNAPGFTDDKFEITSSSATKGKMILTLADRLGISEDDIYVYGDGLNDISMLEQFENSYSPSNACEKAKATAKNVLGDCNSYSVIRHMLEAAGLDADAILR